MRRVLFLCYHFPPIGGAGVQRSVAFARHLPGLGYQPVVVTGTGGTGGRWTPLDTSLDNQYPAEVEVHRVRPPEPPPSTGRAARSERWLRKESPLSRWWVDETVRCGLMVDKIDLVYASMSPFESAEAADRIASRLGVPWVADLRDPWALDEMTIYPSAAHRRLELRRMRDSLASAAVVVMNTAEATRRLRQQLPELNAGWTITNGFERDDFIGLPPSLTAHDRMRIVHTGYLHTELGRGRRGAARARRALGGTPRGVDVLTRSHVILLEALALLTPDERGAIELHLAGVMSTADLDGLDPQLVHLHGYLAHDRSIELMRSADLLFLTDARSPRRDARRNRSREDRTSISPRRGRSSPQCLMVTHAISSTRRGTRSCAVLPTRREWRGCSVRRSVASGRGRFSRPRMQRWSRDTSAGCSPGSSPACSIARSAAGCRFAAACQTPSASSGSDPS